MANLKIDWCETAKAAIAERWTAFKVGLTPKNVFACVVAAAVTAGAIVLLLAGLGAIVFLLQLLAGAFKK